MFVLTALPHWVQPALIISACIFWSSIHLCDLNSTFVFSSPGSTSKSGVRFHDDDDEDAPINNSCDEKLQDKVITALPEPDGAYLVKVKKKKKTLSKFFLTNTLKNKQAKKKQSIRCVAWWNLWKLCIQVGFLRSHHKYEIVFSLPQVPTLGKDVSLSPALRASAKPRLRATHITPRTEGMFL